jgi:hypothetical protein
MADLPAERNGSAASKPPRGVVGGGEHEINPAANFKKLPPAALMEQFKHTTLSSLFGKNLKSLNLYGFQEFC